MVGRPLEGLKVVDCSGDFAGLRTTGVLADYGAAVTWIEPPGGALFRSREPAATSVFNRGKRSVVLDIEQDDDRERILNLLSSADVFVEDFPPGVADRLALDYAHLHAVYPATVRCSISGFGPDPRFRHLPAREALVHAIQGGFAEQAGHREGPIYQGLPFASIGASYLALIGVLAALVRRSSDGVGRLVETSLFDGALAYHGMVWGETDQSVAEGASTMGTRRRRATSMSRFITRSYVCADDQYLGIHTGAVGAFDRLMAVLGLSEKLPPVEGARSLGGDLSDEQLVIINDEIPRILASQHRKYWIDRLVAADVCAVEHLHPTEAFDTPQVVHNEMTVTVEDPVLGFVEQVAPPVSFDGTRPSILRPPPAAGEDTDEIMRAGHHQGRHPTHPADREPAPAEPLLAGIRVVDLGAFFAGPFASRLLADLGADVVKVEPISGDPMRAPTPTFFNAESGKRFIAADLKDPAIKPVLERLISSADVVHHNLRPGAAERLGIDAASVHKVNPTAVYLHAPGWGSAGPFALRQSFAPMISGYTGVTFEVAGQWNEPLPPSGSEDPGTGLLSACAILMALMQRARTGEGVCVECPQLNATMSHMAHVVRSMGDGTEQGSGTVIGAGRLDTLQLGRSAMDRLYQTADGWITVVAYDDAEAAGLGKVLSVDIEGDRRFASDDARREPDNDAALAELLATAFENRRTADLITDLGAAGVPAAEPAGVDAAHRLLNDPMHRSLGRTVELTDPTLGNVRVIARLVRVSDSAAAPQRLAPPLGRDTDDILSELGFDAVEIARLYRRGSVR